MSPASPIPSASSPARWVERRRVCLAYSPGGHYAELRRALDGIELVDCCHVTFDDGRARRLPEGHRLWRLVHPRRSVWRTLLNALQALVVILWERPRLVVSTGADVAVAPVILARLVGARTVFIETGGTLEPSLAGRLVYPFTNLFIVPWPEKLQAFPEAVLARGLLL